MSRRFTPSASQRAETKYDRKVRDNFFQLKVNEEIDHEWLDTLKGRITFLTGTMGYVDPNAKCKRFRFSTSKHIPYRIIKSTVGPMLPDGTKMSQSGWYK